MRADAQQNRERLLAAARAMTRQGDAPALNELARRAGMGVATVYRHFPDANALATALMEQPLAELGLLLERATDERDPGVALRTLFVGVLELELANPLVAQLVHAPETTSEPVRQLLLRMQLVAEDVIRRARRAKVVRPSITGDDLCRLLLGVHSAARAGDEPTIAARRYADIVLSGLRASSTKSRG